MGWYKQHSSFSENPFNKPTVDRCINCGQTKEVKLQSQWNSARATIILVQSARIVIQLIMAQEYRKYNRETCDQKTQKPRCWFWAPVLGFRGVLLIFKGSSKTKKYYY